MEAERQRGEADRQRHEAETQQERNQQLRALLRDALDRLEQDVQEREQARQGLLASLDRELRARGVQVVVDQHSGVLRLSGDLLFATGSAALSSDAHGPSGSSLTYWRTHCPATRSTRRHPPVPRDRCRHWKRC